MSTSGPDTIHHCCRENGALDSAFNVDIVYPANVYIIIIMPPPLGQGH